MKNFVILLIFSLAVLGCKKNQAPAIGSMGYTPAIKKAGTVFTFVVMASDVDGDLLTYLWVADEGTFLTTDNTPTVQWKSPVDGNGKICTIRVTVSDGEYKVTREEKIQLIAPDLGNLAGYVYYTNFKIPIAGATITAGGEATLSNNDGYFVLAGIPAGESAVKVSRPDFTVSDLVVQIPLNDTLRINSEITSVNYTTKLSGILSNPDGQPVGNARVLVLNPDGTDSKLFSTTNSSGYYRLWYIPFGERVLKVTKAETETIRYFELKETVSCTEIEFQKNLTMQQLMLTGSFKDVRDNRVYQYKTIGNVTWMTENLSYLPQVSPSAQGSAQEAYYYVYGYQGTDIKLAMNTENYKTYGVLYNRPAALKACPAGWHLPAGDPEWKALLAPFGSQAARQIKSRSGWAEGGNGDNTTGFSAMPGGEVKMNGSLNGITYSASFWLSSQIAGSSTSQNVTSFSDYVHTTQANGKEGYSVRCVRNE